MSGISPEEQLRRKNMMDSVLGTHAMEGLVPDEPTLEIMQRYIAGEYTMDQFSSAMDRHALSLVAAAPRLTAVA